MKRELLSERPPTNSSDPMGMVSAVTGRWTDLAAFIGHYFLLLNSGKVEDETLRAAGRGKHRDRRFRLRIEIAIVERGDHFGLEARALRPGGAPIRLSVEPHHN